jgi:glycosyltransferase involved in cell wall biosynthesis
MNVLVISTMYPSEAQPVHAVFVEQRVRALAPHARETVVVPIPWFPLVDRLARYAVRARIPRRETRGGVDVHYPRFLSFPKILKPLDGFFLYLACRRFAHALPRHERPDLLDAHLAFPDGWGAVLLGRELGVPVSVTLRGHDLNDLPRYPVRRRQVAWTLRHADLVIAVAESLREAALGLGAPAERTVLVGNGVDTTRFAPHDRRAARRELGIPEEGRVVLSVGHLVERKGFHHLVRAFPRVLERHPDARLEIVGAPGEEGDFREGIERAIRETGLGERVHLRGAIAHERLGAWYSAADVFALASAKEGRANVLLESLACGTPVVATRVWGTPEIVAEDSLGILVDGAEPETLAAAIDHALTRTWDRERIARSAARFSWEAAASSIAARWSAILGARRRGSRP